MCVGQLGGHSIACFTGEDAVLVELLTRLVPTEEHFQEQSCYSDDDFGPWHLLPVLLAVIVLSEQGRLLDKRQYGLVEHVPQTRSAFLAELRLAAILPTLSFSQVEAGEADDLLF